MALNARTSTFNSSNADDYKQASYALRKIIKTSKRQYKAKIEAQFTTSNYSNMWQGLHNITDYKDRKHPATIPSTSLPDELNTFYARFEVRGSYYTQSAPMVKTAEARPLSVSVADVTRSLWCVNISKDIPDEIPGRVLKPCSHQLAGVFTDIFNLSLSLSVVPQCFKISTIVPIQKTPKVSCLNDWGPLALIPIISKCFEKLIRDHICSILPASLDPLQYGYRNNRSTDDAIAFTLHTALSHLDKRNTFVRMLFVDYSSAFNTILPSKLVVKLRAPGQNNSLCSWILDFLKGRRQGVRLGSNISSPLTLNTRAP